MKAKKKIVSTYKKVRRLKKECDKLWYHAVLASGRKCLVCGGKATQAHHFIPKSLSSYLRLEIDNGCPLCYGCHDRLHRTADPRIIDQIIAKKGETWNLRLGAMREEHPIFRFTVGWLEEKISELEKLLS